MKSIIKKVCEHQSLISQPPVLVDIGASGSLPEQWKLLAPYSICVAFDADTRDFVVSESESGDWKKLYSMNRLVAAKSSEGVDFYLTSSPHCSSTLEPDNEALKPWAFNDLFEVDKVVKLPAVDLQSALERIGLNYIDWYKTDSQGTDLRIFDALPKGVIVKLVSAEFEPGIIDAYKGEDKLHQLMAYMDNLPFWVTHMQIKGSQRIDHDDMQNLNYFQRRYFSSLLKTAPGWCEISYINKFDGNEMTCREYLLAWVVASIKGEHGFAIHVAKDGATKFKEPLFEELKLFSYQRLSSSLGYFTIAKIAIRRIGRLFV
jgi:hypothetical protein